MRMSVAADQSAVSTVASRKPLRWSWGAAVLIVLLLAGILPPLLFLIQSSFYTTLADGSFGELTLAYYVEIFTQPVFGKYLVNTAIYASGTALVAIVLGVLQAWIVERTNTPLRQWAFLVAVISLGLPDVLLTVGWLLALGKSGPVNLAAGYLFGGPGPFFDVYSLTGMILIEGFAWSPLCFLLLSAVFRSTDAGLEEAALMSGASLPQVVKRITLPLALPGIAALVMLIFIRAFEAFEIPALVGIPGNVTVLATEIFESVNATVPPNYGKAAAFSVGLLCIVGLMLRAYSHLSRRAERFQTITGKGYRPRVIDLGRLRYVTATVLMGVFIFLIVLPVAMIAWQSFLPYQQRFSLDAAKAMSMRNFILVFKSQTVREAILNTVILGLATATATTVFCAIAAWFTARRLPGGNLIDQLTMAPLVFPSIVMGIALLQVFLQLPFPFYGTLASIIVASVIRYLPYGMRYAHSGLLQVHRELDEASEMCGANAVTTFVRIIIPLIAPALLTCWLFLFLVSVRVVSLPIMLSGPDSQVMSVAFFSMWQNGQITEVAAMGVTWMTCMTAISSFLYMLARRYGLAIR